MVILAIRFGLRGPNYTVATACASATNAIGDATRNIQDGNADVIVTGGTEAAMTRMGMSAFQNIKALSMYDKMSRRAQVGPLTRIVTDSCSVKVLDLLVFEELEHARARGARIYCEVLGYGASTDAGHITQPDEKGTGAARAMADSLKDAKIHPEDVGYINAHGTSTPLGDKAETLALKSVFGRLCSTGQHLQHQESVGALAGCQWRDRTGVDHQRIAAECCAADHQSRHTRPRLRSGLHA